MIIYDYVDSHISMFEKMYHKRLKEHKQIGYDICARYTIEKQKVGAIFDTDTYAEVYRKDLLEANKEIIIASPVISGPKIEVLIQLLKDQQERALGSESLHGKRTVMASVTAHTGWSYRKGCAPMGLKSIL